MSYPNVLFFFTDDQRFDTIGALGNPHIKTPNMDWLVENGTTFENAYIMGGTDEAVCMPSRAMLMTGRTLFGLSNSGQSIPHNHVMLGETLQENGYRCWGTGKWHNGTGSFSRSFNDGADVYFGGMYDHWMVPVHSFDPSGRYEGRIRRTAAFRPSNDVEDKIADHMHAGSHSSELFAGHAVEFLDNYKESAPFFAYVAFMAPHDPRTMPQEFLNMYEASSIDIGESFIPIHPFDNGELTVRDELLSAIPRKESDVRQHIAEYYAMISHVDAQIGKVIDSLRKSGKLDDTIIVFAGDNGLALGRHGLMGKQNLYDHSLHVPLIMSGPNIPKGKSTRSLVYTADIYPSLCDLMGIDIPETVLGSSFSAIFRQLTAQHREYLYFVYKEFMRAVQVDGYKLIEYHVHGNRHSQLFDLNCDPMETVNLVGELSCQSTVSDLRNNMDKARDEFSDHQAPFDSFWEGFEY